jgi:hypothetical protein
MALINSKTQNNEFLARNFLQQWDLATTTVHTSTAVVGFSKCPKFILLEQWILPVDPSQRWCPLRGLSYQVSESHFALFILSLGNSDWYLQKGSVRIRNNSQGN